MTAYKWYRIRQTLTIWKIFDCELAGLLYVWVLLVCLLIQLETKVRALPFKQNNIMWDFQPLPPPLPHLWVAWLVGCMYGSCLATKCLLIQLETKTALPHRRLHPGRRRRQSVKSDRSCNFCISIFFIFVYFVFHILALLYFCSEGVKKEQSSSRLS